MGVCCNTGNYSQWLYFCIFAYEAWLYSSVIIGCASHYLPRLCITQITACLRYAVTCNRVLALITLLCRKAAIHSFICNKPLRGLPRLTSSATRPRIAPVSHPSTNTVLTNTVQCQLRPITAESKGLHSWLTVIGRERLAGGLWAL